MIVAPWYLVSSPRNYVNGRKHALIKEVFFVVAELTLRPIWSTILDVPLICMFKLDWVGSVDKDPPTTTSTTLYNFFLNVTCDT